MGLGRFVDFTGKEPPGTVSVPEAVFPPVPSFAAGNGDVSRIGKSIRAGVAMLVPGPVIVEGGAKSPGVPGVTDGLLLTKIIVLKWVRAGEPPEAGAVNWDWIVHAVRLFTHPPKTRSRPVLPSWPPPMRVAVALK